jgi:pantoate--beta-alanine ligase
MGRPSTRSPARGFLVVQTPADVRSRVAGARRRGAKVGVVPTMGALHDGHRSLFAEARRQCEFVVATIFVNPAQFGANEDFARYPRPLEADMAACRDAGVDLVFHPAADTMYGEGFQTFVDVERLSTVWEGAYRPGHFRGVATVVLKLLNITDPDVAFFGQKDFQQQLLVRTMCRELDLPVEICTCPTIREPDGLALSSRNRYLSLSERKSALSLFESLQLAAKRLETGETDVESVRRAMLSHLKATPAVAVDYATVVNPANLEELNAPLPEMVALVAARVGNTRLIDNLPISLSR